MQDDDGHTLYRGERMAVCDKTFQLYTDANGPYHADLIPVLPHDEINLESAQPFNCSGDAVRDPRETKGLDYRATIKSESKSSCSTDSCC